MRKVKTLEAEWGHVLQGSLSTGAKEDGLGAFGLLDFTMLWPVLAWCMF
jgi:hypothetical protein